MTLTFCCAGPRAFKLLAAAGLVAVLAPHAAAHAGNLVTPLCPDAQSRKCGIETHFEASGPSGLSLVATAPSRPGTRIGWVSRVRVEHGWRSEVVGWGEVGVDGRAVVEVPKELVGSGVWLAAVPLSDPGPFVWAGGLPGGMGVRVPSVDPVTPMPQPVPRNAVIVTEFMKDPVAVSDARGEWFEVTNTSQHVVNLEGWTLRDEGSNSTVLSGASGAVLVPPFGRIVLGRNADPMENGGVEVDAAYSGFSLGNGADQIVLEAPGGVPVTRVDYGDGPVWPDRPGYSICLSRRAWEHGLHDLPEAWCEAQTVMPSGDHGTPGAANDPCGG